MVPMPPGKFLKVLEFSPLSRALKVLEINVSSGNLMLWSWKDLEFAVFKI